jgi:hypothetical protein
MAEPEFTATGVRIGQRLRSLTRAGKVRITDGRLELLTSAGCEIDSAPVRAVRATRIVPGDRALVRFGGRSYLLTLGEPGAGPRERGAERARRLLAALRARAPHPSHGAAQDAPVHRELRDPLA